LNRLTERNVAIEKLLIHSQKTTILKIIRLVIYITNYFHAYDYSP